MKYWGRKFATGSVLGQFALALGIQQYQKLLLKGVSPLRFAFVQKKAF
jgi:hypothetical protein